nr:MAG TPA: hypothetical protein [Caudoviricetes sp.]
MAEYIVAIFSCLEGEPLRIIIRYPALSLSFVLMGRP